MKQKELNQIDFIETIMVEMYSQSTVCEHLAVNSSLGGGEEVEVLIPAIMKAAQR